MLVTFRTRRDNLETGFSNAGLLVHYRMTAFALTSRQQQVYNVLTEKVPECAKMYFGAVRVWSDQENPERLCMAGHALRELMGKIGPHLDVPVPDPELRKGQGRLNDRFAAVEKRLAKAEKQSGNWTKNRWAGEIHKTTATLLLEVQKCVEWRLLNNRLRKTKAGAIVSKFDPLHSALPEVIQSLRITAWESTQDYFVRIAHHARASATEFDKWLFHLEDLLLRGLAPIVKEGLTEIDAIIKAGEQK